MTAYDRVVVGLDPPAAWRAREVCGIVVVGVKDGRMHVIADRSMLVREPLDWARVAVQAVDEFGAVKIAADRAPWDEIVDHSLHLAGCRVGVGHLRCEREDSRRVLAAYTPGRIVHEQSLHELERDLLAREMDPRAPSPRADALTLAVVVLAAWLEAGGPKTERLRRPVA